MQPQALRATEMRYFPGVGDEVREPGSGRSLVDRRRVTCPGVHVTSTPTQLPGLVLDLPQHPKRPIQASVGALHAMVGRRPDSGESECSSEWLDGDFLFQGPR